jgi:sugar/nucleoside kinase (ribokinase family)
MVETKIHVSGFSLRRSWSRAGASPSAKEKHVTSPRLDVLAIGNAIVDVIATAEPSFIERQGLAKGSMRLIDAEEATRLYAEMGPGREISGGSAANTAAGIAMLGGRAGFIGQVATDQLGEVFGHDIRSIGVEFTTPPREGEVPTARCLILVTPDAQRTMNTFLGASQYLPASALDEAQIRDAAILYLEGYLWDPEEPRRAMVKAIDIARGAGRKIAFTLSDSFLIARHRAGFLELIDGGKIDILFANEEEIKALTCEADFEAAVAAVQGKVPLLVATRSEKGAIAVEAGQRVDVNAEPVSQVIDTTGAGDLFAAGFLFGHTQGRSNQESLRIGAIAASEVISHYGARPETDLQELVAESLA